MEAYNRKPIAMALLRAVLCWFVVYLVAAHVYMFLSWPPDAEDKTDASATVSATVQVSTSTSKKLSATIERLEQQVSDSESQLREWVDATKQEVSLLLHNANQVNVETPALKSQHIKVPQLQRLLSQANLESLTNEELITVLAEATKETDTILSKQEEVVWEGWESILGADYPREAPMPKHCDDGNSNVSPDAARLSDLYSRVQKVEAAMAKRKDAKSPLTTESTERVVATIQQTFEQSGGIEQASDSRDEQNDGNCVDADEVEWLLDEGLNALLRHKDLRMVLQRALAEIDEEAAEKVILDAVLASDKTVKDDKGGSPSINLRHLLDTPLVSQKSPQWLDGAVEHVSGHVDLVDDTLDSLLDEKDDSVGKILVSKLLGAAGRISVPNPYSYIDTKAGILRP